MKKFIYSIAALITLFTACNKADNNKVTPEEQGFYITLPVGFQESKTAYDPSSEVKCKWVAGDKVATKAVYPGQTYADAYWYGDTNGVVLDADGVATISVYASYSNKNKTNKVYAAYPWVGTSSSSASNWDRFDNVVKMPAEQHPTATSFDPLADIMTTLEEEITLTASYQDEKLIFCHRVGFMALSFANLPSEVADEYVETVTIKAKAPLSANLQISEPAAGTKELVLKKVSGTESKEITLSYTADIKASELVAYACVLPGTYSTLSFEIKTKGGKTVTFAERNVNVAIAEGQMIHPTLTYSESKGDTMEEPQPETSYTLTITPSGSYLGAVTTDTSVSDAVKEFGLAGTCAFTTKYNYASNSKPIGKQITSIAVTATSTSSGNIYKYSLSATQTDTGTTNNSNKNLSITNVDNGCCYFALSAYYTGSGSKTTVTKCNISKIVITYTK